MFATGNLSANDSGAGSKNGSDDVTGSSSEDVMDSFVLRTVFITTYAIVFVLGVAGNTLVVYVVWSNPLMRSITNVFIANLAASDIMMCLLAVPFTPISGLLKAWPFGDLLCHLVPMTLGVSVYVSTLTSTAIAVDRYFVIVHPFRPRMRVAACLVLIVAIWLVSVSISLPLALYQEVVWEPIDEYYACQEHWPGPASRQFFTVVSLALQYIVPCLIITYCYSRVSVALRRRARTKIGTGSTYAPAGRRRSGVAGDVGTQQNNRFVIDDDEDQVTCQAIAAGAASALTAVGSGTDLRNRMKLRRKRRTNRMLIAMVAIFVICWMPLNAIILTLEYDEHFGYQPYFLLLFFVAHVIAMSSTVYNPFLYAWMNDNFRKEFRRVLPCLRWSAPRSATICGRRFSFRFLVGGGSSSSSTGAGCGGSPSFYSTVGGYGADKTDAPGSFFARTFSRRLHRGASCTASTRRAAAYNADRQTVRIRNVAAEAGVDGGGVEAITGPRCLALADDQDEGRMFLPEAAKPPAETLQTRDADVRISNGFADDDDRSRRAEIVDRCLRTDQRATAGVC